MRRRRILIAGLVGVGAFASAHSAQAALSEVHLGNFYYEDATVGDGKIEIRQGDQIRFVADDNGPGTPHTVEVDALGIHSGGLSTGQTYTTPPIQQAGSFKLYCKFHENKGHVTTLVVLADGTATTAATTTTAAPTTTVAKASSPTTAGGSTAVAGTSGSTATGGAGTDTTTSVASDGVTATTVTDIAAATATTLAPTGLGEASDETMNALPVDPHSLEAVLGRPPATRGPWTRSVRIAMLGLLPLLGAAAIALGRFASGLSHTTTRADLDESNALTPGGTPSSSGRARRARPFQVDPGAVEPG